jgi:hypothetical protein
MHIDSISHCKPLIDTYIAHYMATSQVFRNNENL